jgi:hypothetical protein
VLFEPLLQPFGEFLELFAGIRYSDLILTPDSIISVAALSRPLNLAASSRDSPSCFWTAFVAGSSAF